MHEYVLLNMFCLIFLTTIIALKLIYIFKGKLEIWVEMPNVRCCMHQKQGVIITNNIIICSL
jgi:hypothetical protein